MFIGAVAYTFLTKKLENQIFSAFIKNIEKALRPKQHVNLLTVLLSEYHEFVNVFSRKNINILPPYRFYNYKIELKENTKLFLSYLYSIFRDKLLILKKYLEEHLKKNFIKINFSPISSLILFIKKLNRELRLYIDYRALNALSIKNQYPLSFIRETLDKLAQIKFFTKLNIIAIFN